MILVGALSDIQMPRLRIRKPSVSFSQPRDTSGEQVLPNFKKIDLKEQKSSQKLVHGFSHSYPTLACEPPVLRLRNEKKTWIHSIWLRDMDYQIVLSLTGSIYGDDQRRLAFWKTHINSFANVFSFSFSSVSRVRRNIFYGCKRCERVWSQI